MTLEPKRSEPELLSSIHDVSGFAGELCQLANDRKRVAVDDPAIAYAV